MPEKAKAPAIRFKGFTDAWEQRKLVDEVELFSGLTYSPNNVVKENGTLVLRSSNVKNGEVVNADNVYVDSSFVNSSNVKEGDIIVVVRNGSRSLIGKHAQIKAEMNNTVIGAFMTGIRSNHSEFINALLNTRGFDSEVEKNLGATINQITNGMFQQMEFMFPKSEEQTRIGEMFTQLDHLITLHQRKLLKLKNVKKAMLEKMFPKNGSNVPEIRFAGFTDAWEQRKAKDIFKSITDKGYPELPVLSASQEFGMINRIETGISIHHDVSNEIGYKRVTPGQFVIHLRSFQGGFAHSSSEGITSPAYTVLDFQEREKHYDYFWKYIFNSELFIKRLELITYGIRDGRSISFNDFSTLDFNYPNCDEERKIGEYFKNLDHLITLHQRKYEKLQNLKKACLEKMFV